MIGEAWVTKGWLGAMALAIGFAAVSCNAGPAAHADTLTCEHRGLAHIDKHGGKTEDDAWHRLHHQRLTCAGDDDKGDKPGDTQPFENHDELHHGHDDDDKDSKHDDTPLPGHRDKPGYGCFMLRCG